jgi:hypothetical protein
MSPTVLALDLSVKSTGFALWSDSQAKPVCGTWELAGGIAHAAKAFVRLHRHLKDVYGLAPIDLIAFEDPLPPHAVHGQTSIDVLKASAGLAAHVQSFSEAMGIRCCAVNQSTWRRHFLGAMPRGTKTPDLKHLAMQRCRELGFEVIKHDAAEACGLLDYQLSIEGIIAPWREGILQRQMTPATDGRRAQA